MSTFSAETYLKDLRPFQRRTVDHVMGRLYGDGDATRFLVADETGLGKSLVARGVIARAIEELQSVDEVARIDVVYVCSNLDVARQNVNRLNVVGTEVPMSTRLSLLATTSGMLDTAPIVGTKPVNLVSLTPGTSFEKGWRTGTVDERALLMTILERHVGFSRAERTAAYRILQGGVSTWKRFRDRVDAFQIKHGDTLDERIIKRFMTSMRRAGKDTTSPLHRFKVLLADTAGRTSVPGGYEAAAHLVGEMRTLLAHAGVEALEPDLVILDEFQRFSDLLDERTEAGELAHQLFGYEAARVLLLSATPFRAFTGDEDLAGHATHHKQFQQTLDFLIKGSRDADASTRVTALLDSFRDDVLSGTEPTTHARRLRTELLKWMSRTERPASINDAMLGELITPAAAVCADDVRGYLDLVTLAGHVEAQMSLEVWKSVPHLIHFMDSYQVGRHVRNAIADGDTDALDLIDRMNPIDPMQVTHFEALPSGNARLESLKEATTQRNWHRLLWVPPSLPYFLPAGPFADPAVAGMTKKLVFSSWTATPTSVASLLSYEANRRIAADSGRRVENTPRGLDRIGSRLQLRLRDNQPTAMTSLIPFLPLPGIAERGDPLVLSGGHSELLDADDAARAVTARFAADIPTSSTASDASAFASLHWQWPMVLEGNGLTAAITDLGVERCAFALSGVPEDTAAPDPDESALERYVRAAAATADDDLDLSHIPGDLAESTALLAMHSPANCAWRALGRLPVDTTAVTPAGRWAAAAVIASGFRTIFNRWDASLLLDSLYPDEDLPYWRKVLRYCADGNLQAVLDEYLYHLVGVEGNRSFDDQEIRAFAHTAADALRLKPAGYKAKDPLQRENGDIDFQSRFALRYGESKADEQSLRPAEVRAAFNSPFWPFVLVSTSVGQEGIDFHPWCHNLVHWNVPSNPVDFEQRDGRVNRFRGHALRRNIADAFSVKMRDSDNPWTAGYALAAERDDERSVDGLAPDWVFAGDHKVIREIMPYQLSTDSVRLSRIHRRVALYRLTFGQPRQEDLLDVLQAHNVKSEDAERWRVDLAP